MAAPFTGRPTAQAAQAVLFFWFDEAKPCQWFRTDHAFDQTIRRRFGVLHKAASTGRLNVWRAHPVHALALIILLDQFSRNIHRGDARAFAQDAQALSVAREVISRRFDRLYDAKERAFFYMPFMHAEELAAQEQCVRLFKAGLPATDNMPFAKGHCDIIKRFGRFPHRNKTIRRTSTPAEIAFLKAGGFNP